MPVRKFVENNSPSQNFFYRRSGIQRGKILKFEELLEFWDNWDKLAASESGAQMKVIDAKKVYKKISWDYPFKHRLYAEWIWTPGQMPRVKLCIFIMYSVWNKTVLLCQICKIS
jgi:hypothetical protein